MSFYVLTVVGIAVGLGFLAVRGEGARLGPASAIALGIGGAWNGALFAAAFRRGGWIALDGVALAGGILGAVGFVVAVELVADLYRRYERRAT